MVTLCLNSDCKCSVESHGQRQGHKAEGRGGGQRESEGLCQKRTFSVCLECSWLTPKLVAQLTKFSADKEVECVCTPLEATRE